MRPLLTDIGVFLIPFAVYAGFLIATQAGLLHPDSWPLWRVGWLAAIALAMVAASIFYLADFRGAPPGSTYIPAHVENGKLVHGVEK